VKVLIWAGTLPNFGTYMENMWQGSTEDLFSKRKTKLESHSPEPIWADKGPQRT
jgi:hypothetical protein